jgi:tetratricopeptide (TPR) repeat protein
MGKLSLTDQVKALLRQLKIKVALELLDKASEDEVKNANSFLANQARMKLGAVDSSSDEEGLTANADTHDPERLPEDPPPYPVVPYHPECEPSEAQIVATNKAKQLAQRAFLQKDMTGALKWYTEAVNAGGAAALMLAKRGELLLKMKRPNAAIHDATAAIEVNPDCSKAYHVRGMAHRKLGHWYEANDDLSQGQKLDFDEEYITAHNFVALQVNQMQERGVKRRKT